MQLFYHPDLHEHTKFFSFDREESKHLLKVLRKNTGDTIWVTNGDHWLFEAEITEANAQECKLRVITATRKGARNYALHMAVAPTRTNDRYEWFLEKAVEIGVDEITPLICSRSERKTAKPERWKKIMVSAMKQSLQYSLPKLNKAIDFQDFIDQPFNGQLFIAHCGKSERASLKRKALADHKVTILIGPEGDFSEEEIHLAEQKGCIPVSLGGTRLRTETAALVACHTVALINA